MAGLETSPVFQVGGTEALSPGGGHCGGTGEW